MNDDRLDGITTRWSLVRRAHMKGDAASAAEARSILVMRYASAIRRYIGGILKDCDETDEVAQDVIVRLLKGDFAGADPDRGRFRDLLKTAVRNMVRNHWTKKNQRRAVSDPDFDQIADADEATPESAWMSAWKANLLDHVWAELQDMERKNPKNPAYTVLKWRTDYPEESSDQLAVRLSEKLGSPVRPDAARQMLRRARVRFAELLIQEISMGLDGASQQEIEDELAAVGLLELVRDYLPKESEPEA